MFTYLSSITQANSACQDFTKNIALEKLEEGYEQSEKLVDSEQYLTLTTTTTANCLKK